MAVSDAFLVGEDWISEHYFTTEATSQSFHSKVLERRRRWEAEESETSRSRFTAVRGALEKQFTALLGDDEQSVAESAALHKELVTVLGFHTGEFVLDTTGPVTAVATPGITGPAPLVIVAGSAADSIDDVLAKDARTLAEEVVTEDGTEITSVARLLSSLFVQDEAPRFALVLAGRWAVVAQQERWAEGRYLAIDLQLVCERNDAKRGGEIDRALTCLEATSLGPDADGDIWWSAILDESIKHTVGVSKDLREGVRLSIEIIANEVVRRRAAQGLDPLPPEEAQPLAVQSLRFLYRILFLLYAEASPELGVLPAGAGEYDQGYSLDRLRDLTLVTLTSEQSKTGTHLYDSLQLLFRLIDKGHGYVAGSPSVAEPTPEVGEQSGLVFSPLRADLFLPKATSHIDEVRLGNEALQRVLRHLLLSKESRGRDRGFISYVELGINQLGAVYEGLMSYTGFFAEEELFEVAKGGDSSKGSWVVPVNGADHLDPDDFVTTEDEVTGERRPVRHAQRTFVFRLAGRERQQSASYYTPEVLTRFTVSQALEELLDQDGHTTTAEEILELTVCEPALGSGAFAIEAVRQLAAEYLKRRQVELGERIDPDRYPEELQKVKAHIALHQVHGVDLNATAAELAEVSLWLDTMVAGLQAPWFGLRLRRGNSLIGARRAVYSQSQVKDRSWLMSTPVDIPLTELADNIAKGLNVSATSSRVHQFLLPAQGWGSATEVPRDVAALAADEVAALRTWRRSMRAKPTTKQLQQFTSLSERVEKLWQFALRRLRIAELESSRTIELWGRETAHHAPAVSREQIEASLSDENGAYRRLRLVMDLWCALWFWPLAETGVKPPTLDQWTDAAQQILGISQPSKHRWMDTFGGASSTWEGLNAEEEDNLNWAVAQPIEQVRAKHQWVAVCEQVAARQGFFHWELDFATVFARGGFDLQVGNPPWVRPAADVDALLAEGDPWWQLAVKPSEDEREARFAVTVSLEGMKELLLDGTLDAIGTREFLGDPTVYPVLRGLQPDLYRCFMAGVWRLSSAGGISGLIHLESHFTDQRAGLLRANTYARLRRHWQFINELKLFEIQDQKTFGVNIYGRSTEVGFWQATALYQPETVLRSFAHDGTGMEPGFKDPQGGWDLRPHRNRIQWVNDDELSSWRDVLEEPDTPSHTTRMLYSVNSAASKTLRRLSMSTRVSGLALHFSPGWHERGDRAKGRFRSRWGEADWSSAILQGPHLSVTTPLAKSPNPSMRHQQDWTSTDIEALPADALPVTAYKPVGDRATYDAAYTHWQDPVDEDRPYAARDYYRIAWRCMAANTGERTLIPAIIPPGAAHVDGLFSAGLPNGREDHLSLATGVLSSPLADFAVRTAPKSTIRAGTANRLPMVSTDHPLAKSLGLRVVRLNCVTDAYADLWASCWDEAFEHDEPVLARQAAGPIGPTWTSDTPLRRAVDRRNALVEIDALVALMLDVDVDDLCTVYRTQFAVLYGYDHGAYTYDANGRLVPNSVLTVWRQRGDRITEDERKAVHPGSGVEYTYELPFGTLDREADMRTAYAEFQRRLEAAEADQS
ncbi:Eco57I restriction-modification methylase domain-containing protein [Pedococcus sp. 5OH_020]|uniref:Eco57I restriction-modification methylase domain-containing protein n=1 Tax=Pedococcus sp. 5OH_020 TaxID=2989814 RepID=UPI0022E9B66F|nr:DNA methyltransferase [Pedococcus sp. 5OH_020]